MRSLAVLITLLIALHANAQTLRFFEFAFRTPLPDSMNVFAAATDTAIINNALSQLALPEAQRNRFISGQLQYGTETNNPLYSWHFVTDAWNLVELAVEVCDGRPDDVENDKQYWIETVGYFCPWSSFVKREIFPSEVDDVISKKIRLYPNPASDFLTIDADPSIDIRELYVLDALGKLVLTLPAQERAINLTSLPRGHYYIIVRHFDGNSVYKISRN